MIVGSVCSGILSDAVAWGPLGWRHAWCAEWAPPEARPAEIALSRFNQRLIAHHYPGLENLGDFTQIPAERAGVDLLVGGTPCQDFSVAGLRAGLGGARGALALEFLRLAGRLAPRWIVWENVPGVMQADGGRALGAFLGGLAELGYGFAYRVLDAQFFGLAQRRKRVFVVAHSGGQWQRAAAVLLEREGLRWDPPPSGEEGQIVAGCLESRARSGGHDVGAHGAATGHLIVAASVIAIQDPRGRRQQNGTGIAAIGAPSYTMESHPPGVAVLPAKGAHPPAIAFHATQDPIHGPVSPALGRKSQGMGVGVGASVRRLMPVECERLQGFPDGYTAIPKAKDGNRYAALGNAIAVAVLAWLGRRIALVDEIGGPA